MSLRAGAKILITGASGLLGSNLAFFLKDHFEVLGLYHQHAVVLQGVRTQKVNLLSKEEIRAAVDSFSPDVVIHCAALVDIDYCERNKDQAQRVNVDVTRDIVECISGGAAKFVYISTDAVYDGGKGNFSEEDKINPANYYGWTKYGGEEKAFQHPNTLVARLSIFGWNIQPKNSLAEWVIEELSRGRGIKGFADVHSSLIYTLDFAGLLEEALEKDLRGIYNFNCSNSMTKYDFAVRIAELFGFDKKSIEPISVNASALTAKRGRNLTLDTKKLADALGHSMPTVEESLDHFYRDFKSGLPHQIKGLAGAHHHEVF